MALEPGGSSGEGTLYGLQTFSSNLGYCGEVYLNTRYWYKNNRQTGISPNRGTRNINWPYQCIVNDIHISSSGDQTVNHSVSYEFVLNLGWGDFGFDIVSLTGTVSDYFVIPQTN